MIIYECLEFLPSEADLTLWFAIYLGKLNCLIKPHLFIRDISLLQREKYLPYRRMLTVVLLTVIMPNPGLTKKDFLVSEWEEIKMKSLPKSLRYFYCLKFACNHP